MGSIDAKVNTEPHGVSTTGLIEVWDGTEDGKPAWIEIPSGKTNLNPLKRLSVSVRDIRQQDAASTTEEKAFRIVQYPTSISDACFYAAILPDGKEYIRKHYYPEIANLLMEVTGADKVVPFHSEARNEAPKVLPDKSYFRTDDFSPPAYMLHVDHDHRIAVHAMRRFLGKDEAEKLLSSYEYFAIYNVWRPFSVPAQSKPLVLVDVSGVKQWSYEDHLGHVYDGDRPKDPDAYHCVLKPDKDYVFWYGSNIAVNEALVFRDYDSRRDKVRATPHGAFRDDNTPIDAPPRRSIDVRSFVFFGRKGGQGK